MILSAIVAMDRQRAIGKANDLPWRLPNDLKFFKKTTLDKPMLMGRKTFESLGGVLPRRLHIVISSRDLQLPEGVLQHRSLEAGLDALRATGQEEGFVIGGGEVFRQTLPMLQRLYITQVDTLVPDADAFFPEIDFSLWQLEWEEAHPADERHPFGYTFQRWERRQS